MIGSILKLVLDGVEEVPTASTSSKRPAPKPVKSRKAKEADRQIANEEAEILVEEVRKLRTRASILLETADLMESRGSR
jgi:hypothetical protein